MNSHVRNPWRQNNPDGLDDDLIDQNGDENHSTNGQDDDSPTEQHPAQNQAQKPTYTSQWATLLITVNVTIGVGLLAMPFNMQMAGVVTAMIVQLLFLAMIVITCIMCIEMTVKSEVKSYHEIVQVHCHPIVYKFTQLSIFLIVFGACVAYITTIGDQTDRLFASLYGPSFCRSWYLDRHFIMAFVTLVSIKPLCSARTVDFLKYASSLGIMSIGFIFYVVLKEFIDTDKIASDVNYSPRSWINIAAILPNFCLAYQCHLSLVPTVATIRRREKSKAFTTASIAMVIAMIIYSAISILAVLTFGSKIKEDLTESYPGKNWATLTTIAIIAVKCVLTLPAAYLPARLSLMDILTNNWSYYSNLSENIRRISVTVIFFDLALFAAIFVPDIVVAVNLLGCLAVVFIFTLPGLAYLSLIKVNRLEKQRAEGGDPTLPKYTSRDMMKIIASYFMIIVGILMTVLVLYMSISEILNGKPSEPLCKK